MRWWDGTWVRLLLRFRGFGSRRVYERRERPKVQWLYRGRGHFDHCRCAFPKNANASTAQVLQAIANAGFDPIGSSTNAGYGQRVASTIGSYQSMIDCLNSSGYVHL